VDPDILAAWRDAFVHEHEATIDDPADLERLRNWAQLSLGSQGLPRGLRALWNDHLKREVVARLTRWFEANHHPIPELVLK
jgi:hypothetical protein